MTLNIIMGTPFQKRIVIVAGHYGSGKTEFAVNYALALAESGKQTAIADVDIANPYFRSRERQALMESKGIAVYSNTYHYDITADLPALAADIRSPLENPAIHTIVDAGGDGTGAMVLVQFSKYFTEADSELLCVINANRPETHTPEGVLDHIRSIEANSGLRVTGLVNNTHMLRETTAADILKGYRLSLLAGEELNIPVAYNCCLTQLLPEFIGLLKKEEQNGLLSSQDIRIFPIDGLQMRETWLDVQLGPPKRSPLM